MVKGTPDLPSLGGLQRVSIYFRRKQKVILIRKQDQ